MHLDLIRIPYLVEASRHACLGKMREQNHELLRG